MSWIIMELKVMESGFFKNDKQTSKLFIPDKFPLPTPFFPAIISLWFWLILLEKSKNSSRTL